MPINSIPKSVPKAQRLNFLRLIAKGYNARTAAAHTKQGRRWLKSP